MKKLLTLFCVLCCLVSFHATAATFTVYVGGDGAGMTGTGTAVAFTVEGEATGMGDLTITTADDINFIWVAGNHNVNFTQAPFTAGTADAPVDSGAPEVNDGKIFNVTGADLGVGSHFYQCDVHAPAMAGTITVNPLGGNDSDECITAIDISAAFADPATPTFNRIGPFDLQGTPGADDPAEPDCFADDATTLELSHWFVFTVPADGSYTIVTSAEGDSDCGITNPLGGDADTEMALYDGTNGCPTAATAADAYIECNEDLNGSAPWISGFTVELTAGTVYYILIDTWDAVTGEICFDITSGEIICGDGDCAAVENYNNCPADCPCIVGFRYIDWQNPAGLVTSATPMSYCAESLTRTDIGYNGGSTGDPALVFIPFVVDSDNDPGDNSVFGTTITDVGEIYSSSSPPSLNTTMEEDGFISFLAVSEDDIANNAGATITFFGNDPNCVGSIFLDFADLTEFPRDCTPSCIAGDVDTGLDGQSVCSAGTINLGTDGSEDLTLPCGSDDGSGFVYGWIARADTDNDGIFETTTTFVNTFDTPNVTADVSGILYDISGAFGGTTDPGGAVPLPAGIYQVCGVAGCFNSDGSGVQTCTTPNCLTVTLLDDADPACAPTCVAGTVDPALDGQVVCPSDDLMVGTDGSEDLTLPCGSDDGSGYEYGWVAVADVDGDGAFETTTSFVNVFGASNVTVTASEILYDVTGNFGGAPDAPVNLPAGEYLVCGVAGCFNADGSAVETCFSDLCLLVTIQDDAICTTCVAGDVDPTLDGQTVCPFGDLQLGTDGSEDLTLPCGSDDGSGYEYGWAAVADLEGDGSFETVTSFVNIFESANTTVTASEVLYDVTGNFGGAPDAPVLLPPGEYLVCGVAGCFNEDGSAVETCFSETCLLVTLLDRPQINDLVADGCSVTATISGGTSADGSYSWEITDTLFNPLDPPLTGTTGTDGALSIALPDGTDFVLFVTDDNGCTSGVRFATDCSNCAADAGAPTPPAVDTLCNNAADLTFTFPATFDTEPVLTGTDTYGYVITQPTADGMDFTIIETIITDGSADYSFTATSGPGTYCIHGVAIDGVAAADAGISLLTEDLAGMLASELIIAATTAGICYAIVEVPNCVTVLEDITGVVIGIDCATGGASGTLTVDLSGAMGGSGAGYAVAMDSPNSAGEVINFADYPFTATVAVVDDAGCRYEFTQADLSCPVTCPTIATISADTSVCASAGAPTLAATLADGDLGTLTSVDWSVDGASVGTELTLTPMAPTVDCASMAITYTFTANCIDGTSVSDDVVVTYYPEVQAGTTATSADGCTVTLTPGCEGYTITWDDGNGGTGDGPVFSAAPFAAGTVTFTATQDGAPAACASATATGSYDCQSACPSITSVTPDGSACNNDVVNLAIEIADPEGNLDFVEWSDASGVIATDVNSIDVSPIVEGCDAQTFAYTVRAVCTDGTEDARTINVTFYPSMIEGVVTEDGCTVSYEAGCPNYTVTYSVDGNDPVEGTSYTADPATSGSVVFTATNADAPAACSTTTSSGNYDCPSVLCPEIASVSDAQVACSGETVTLTGMEGGDLTNFLNVQWTDADGNEISTSNTIEVSDEVTGCDPVTTTYTFTVLCSVDGATAASATVDVTWYPQPTVGTATLSEDGCTVSYEPACPNYTITYSVDANEPVEGTSYTANPGESGMVFFTETNADAPEACQTASTDPVSFDCPDSPCPFIDSISDNAVACSGETVTLSASVNDEAGTLAGVEWTDADGNVLGTENTLDVSEEITGCESTTTTYTFTALCSVDGATAASRTVDVTWYPQAVVGTATVSEDGCTVSYEPACPDYAITYTVDANDAVEGTSYTAAPGESGTVFFTETNADAPEACQTASTDPVSFDCPAPSGCPTITTVSEDATTCSGETVTLTATIDDPDGTLQSISWTDAEGNEISTEASVDVSPTNDACDAATFEYTVTVTCSTDQSTVSDNVTITVYAATTAGTATVSEDGCTVSYTADCENYAVTYSVDGGDAVEGTEYVADPGTTGAIVFTATNPDAPEACNTASTEPATFDCPPLPVCPSNLVADRSVADICSGETATLTATIDDLDGTLGTLVWTDADGNEVGTGASIEVSPTSEACGLARFDYTVTATCTVDPDFVATAMTSVTVCPSAETLASFVTVTTGPNGCVINASTDCDIVDINGEGSSATVSTDVDGNMDEVTFTITNTQAPSFLACQSTTITANFNCVVPEVACPFITPGSISGQAAMCTGGTVNLSVDVTEGDEGFSVEWFENAVSIGTGLTLDVDVTANSCDVETRTYTAVVTPDNTIDCVADEASIDVIILPALELELVADGDCENGYTFSNASSCDLGGVATVLSPASIDGPLHGTTGSVDVTLSYADFAMCAPATQTFDYDCPELMCENPIQASVEVTCSGANDGTGTATLTVTGGDELPYTLSDSDFVEQSAGVYTKAVVDGEMGSVTVTDASGLCVGSADYTVDCPIIEENNDPIAIADVVVTVNENGSVTIDPSSVASDPDGDPLTFGDAAIAPDNAGMFDPATGVFTPAADFVGTVTITVTVSDGNGGSVEVQFTVEVQEMVMENRPPVAVDDFETTPFETDLLGINVLNNDSDPDGDELTVTNVELISGQGQFVINTGKANETIDYIAAADFSGDAVAEYTITDGEFTATALLTVTVGEDMTGCDGSLALAGDVIVELNSDGETFNVFATVTGGTPPYTGALQDPNQIEVGTGEAGVDGEVLDIRNIPLPQASTTYTLVVVDAQGCVVQETVELIRVTSVELLSLDGEVLPAGNLVSWITASEIDNDFFTLAHSTDGTNFTTIATIDGHGTSTTANEYSFLDKAAVAGVNYYQLTQTDFDGTTTTVGSIVLVRGETGFELVGVLPVPTQDVVTVTYISSETANVEANVFDITGKMVMSRTVTAQNGENTLTLDLTDLPTGMYFLAVGNGTSVAKTKLIKE